MNVFEAIKDRRSVRSYQSKDIEEEKLYRILDAGRLAPSANNTQEWKFIVVKDKAIKESLVKAAYGQSFVAQAPIVIVACATMTHRLMTCGQFADTIDLSIAMSYMMLEACELGLGTCWLGHFNAEEVKQILSIPDNASVIAMTPIGYSTQNISARPRKNIEEVVCFDTFT